MENEECLDIKEGLSVGTMKIANKYEIFTEEEIDTINNKIPELDGRVGVIEDEIEEINSSLDDKANSEEFVKKGYGTLNDFNEETRLIIQGMDSGQINAVLGEGNVRLNNLSGEIITLVKGNNLITGTQIFEFKGMYGTKPYNCTNFIDVKIGDTLYLSKTFHHLVCVDDSNNLLETISLSGHTAYTIKTDYAKVCFTVYDQTTDFMESGFIVTKEKTYIPNRYEFNANIMPLLNGDNISDSSLSINKLDSTFTNIEKGTNLYKYNEHLYNYTIKDSEGNKIMTNNFTNWIEVIPGVSYASSLYYTQFYFFNSNKEYLSQTTIIVNPAVFTPPNNCKYVLIRGNADENIKVCEGTSLDGITDDRIVINPNLLPSVTGSYGSRWKGKKWVVIGDSISVLAEKNYHDFVGKDLGMTVTNLSISGMTMLDGIKWVGTMPANYDLVTVMMGTNDQGYNCGIGSFNDGVDFSTNDSFYSRVQEMIRKLRAKNPKAQIVMITPIRRHGTESQKNNEDGFMVNALYKTTKEYGDVIKDCCDKLGVHCLDLYECGLDARDEATRSIYFLNSEDGTHPNSLGQATFLAPKVRDFLEKIAPYELD